MPQTWGRYFLIQNVMSIEQGARDSESDLGIDYHEHFSGDLRQILMTGEREWLANAAELHRWDTGEMWSVVMLPRLTEGRLKPEDYEELMRFCPIMLDALSRQRIKRTKSQIMARILAALDPEE
jgi:hypothetical protein